MKWKKIALTKLQVVKYSSKKQKDPWIHPVLLPLDELGDGNPEVAAGAASHLRLALVVNVQSSVFQGHQGCAQRTIAGTGSGHHSVRYRRFPGDGIARNAFRDTSIPFLSLRTF